MKRLANKVSALFLALCLLAGLSAPIAWADDDTTVIISSVEDLVQFSKNCTLDTWSQGKTVKLTADIDLAGREFASIPTFGGTFQGNGHTISGLRVTINGSHMGLFRYIQSGAVVQDLNVTGSVAPNGSRSTVGGIVGVNSGAVRNCTFKGLVRGDSSVGGIAGENTASGEITGCSASGTVLGEVRTGGVVGRNSGLLLKCANSANVNTTDPDTSIDLDDLTNQSAWEQLTTSDSEDGDSLRDSHTDTGGVVGWSCGVVQSCSNSGTVGYPHVGYNVGGVAGRQTGYLAGCSNSGEVYGRKDVGGIVGQSEPDVIINPGDDTLERLRRELDTLDALVDKALDDADASRADISAQLTAIGDTTDSARDSSKVLLDDIADFADDNIDTINSLSVSLTAALDKIDPALTDLSAVADRLEDLSDRLGDAMNTLGTAADLGDDTMGQLSDAVKDFRQAGSTAKTAIGELQSAVAYLQQSVVISDMTAVENALKQIVYYSGLIGPAISDAGVALTDLSNILAYALAGQTDAVIRMAGDIGTLGTSLSTIGTAMTKVSEAVNVIAANVTFYPEKAQLALQDLSKALGDLSIAAGQLDSGMADLLTALQTGENLTGELGVAMDQMEDAADIAAAMSRKLKSAFEEIQDAVEQLQEDGPFLFTTVSQDIRDAGNDLYDSLSQLSDQMADLQDAVNDAGDTLSADLRAISRQMNKVFDLIIDALSDASEVTDEEVDDLIEDTSDEDISNTRQGKVTDCRNTGAIDGDRNVGGVIGSMSIEYDADPEDEVTHLSMGNTYETKAVLQSSVNHGPVTAKKDCAGGLVGSMELGTTLDCQNYGAVASTDGSYVGGIAGLSQSTVRSSYSKCVLSGTDYIGGIVGWGTRVTDCAAIATVEEGTEYVGAIAGDVDTDEGTIRGNRFVDTGVAGIDGISYSGVAEPVEFETLRQLSNIPTEFVSFTLTLTADDETVTTIPFQYGADLKLVDLPEAPEKEGYYGSWPEFDTSGLTSDITLEAVYTPWVTLVASTAQDGKLALALAEGQFTENTVLNVEESAVVPPQTENPELEADVWNISLASSDLTETDEVPLRLLNRGGGKAAVYQLVNGQWQRVETTASGHYLLLTMTGTAGTFCIQSVQSGALWLFAALAAAAVVVLLLLILLLRRIHRKKKAAKAAKRSQEQPVEK